MPLRDPFRPPVVKRSSWEGFHAMWPTVIVQQLRAVLPPGYVAEPRVHLGTVMEIDISAPEIRDDPSYGFTAQTNGGVATATWTGSPAVLALDTDIPGEYEYEVRVYDLERDRELVAAIELVSPANKDRPKSRDIFVANCAALLRKGVAVSVIDLVTVRRHNVYAQLMEFIGHPDRTMSIDGPPTYAASCRWINLGRRAKLEAWSHTLVVGEPLPTLPLWLDHELVVPLDLDSSYEKACGDSSIV